MKYSNKIFSLMKTTFLITFYFSLFTACPDMAGFEVFAQWQPDIRLTNDFSGSLTSYNNARYIATNGNDIHVVWEDQRNGNREIYYKRSTDGGISWGADTRLTNHSTSSLSPSISITGQVVHVVWWNNRFGDFDIYHKRSIDGGVSWEADTRLTIDPAYSGNPSVSVSGQVVHVVWDDNRDGNFEIYYKRSGDGGVSWYEDTRLMNNAGNSRFPSIAISGLVLHIVWLDNRDGNYEIYYKRSTDGGVSWSVDTRLTNDPAISEFPSVSVSSLNVHVVWHDTRDGNREIYHKRSTDGGVSWGADTRLTSNTADSRYPSVTVSLSNVHIVWHDARDGNLEIYYKQSTDGGNTWSVDTRLTNYTGTSQFPSVAVSGSVVHIVWADNRDDGWWEIYYKRNPTGNILGINNISSEIPSSYRLYQNYPNPFNPTTKIRFAISGTSVAQTFLSVYDILGSEVATLINEQLKPGTYEVDFDGTNLPSGIYLYVIRTESFSETKKMILIR